MAEKLCALMGRTEPRDLYDLYCLFESGDVDLSLLPASFAVKCRHKGLDPAQLDDVLTGKAPTFGKLWTPRLAVQVVKLLDVKDVLRTVRRHLRGIGLT